MKEKIEEVTCGKQGKQGKQGKRDYFEFRIRKRVVSLFVAVVMCVSAVVAGVVFWNLKPKVPGDASSNSTNTGTYDEKYTGLFIKDPNNENAGLMGPNGVNKSIARQLIFALENAGVTSSNTRDASHFGASVPGVGIYGNGAIYVRLFDSTGSDNMKSFTTSSSSQGGGARWWRAVYAQNGTITFWMAEGYRSVSHTITSSGTGTTYSSTPMRTEINTDFNAVYNGLNGDAKALIKTPSIGAQSNSPTPSYSTAVPNPAVPSGDKVFLPSVWEIANNSTSQQSGSTTDSAANEQTRSGLWSMSGLDRGNAYNSAWLRSLWFFTRTDHGNGYYDADNSQCVKNHYFEVGGAEQTGRAYSLGDNRNTNESGPIPKGASHMYSPEGTNSWCTTMPSAPTEATVSSTLRPALSLSWNDLYPYSETLVTYARGQGADVQGSAIYTEIKPVGQTYTIAGNTIFSREGYTQIGWATSEERADAMLVDYASSGLAIYTLEEDLTLYPVWLQDGPVFDVGTIRLNYVGGGGGTEMYEGLVTTWYFSGLFETSMWLPSVDVMNLHATKAGTGKVFLGWYEDEGCTIEMEPDANGNVRIPVEWVGQVKDVYAKWV